MGAKAALISGPPGIGKTTSARIVANHLGFKVLEWNASDVRSKISIENGISHLANNHTLKGSTGNNMNINSKTLIIMDEIDGMTGSDKGGLYYE